MLCARQGQFERPTPPQMICRSGILPDQFLPAEDCSHLLGCQCRAPGAVNGSGRTARVCSKCRLLTILAPLDLFTHVEARLYEYKTVRHCQMLLGVKNVALEEKVCISFWASKIILVGPQGWSHGYNPASGAEKPFLRLRPRIVNTANSPNIITDWHRLLVKSICTLILNTCFIVPFTMKCESPPVKKQLRHHPLRQKPCFQRGPLKVSSMKLEFFQKEKLST